MQYALQHRYISKESEAAGKAFPFICSHLIQILRMRSYLWACQSSLDTLINKENAVVCLLNEEEQLRLTERKLQEEQAKLSEAQSELLSKREKLLQQQQQAVAESERECAVSLAEVQKQAAELAVEESLFQEKKQQLDVLEKQLKKTLHDMQLETENLTKHKLLVEEKQSEFLEKEKAVERQRVQVEEENDKLREEWEKLKGQKTSDSKEREATKDLQGRLSVKEDMLKGIEKELEEKCLAVESLARKLNAREKLLKNIQKQSEEDRIQLNDHMKKLDGERRSLEEAKAELELSRRNVEAGRESLFQDIKSADERMKEWESRLKQQEEEAQQKQEFLEGLEAQVKNEQQRCHMLHTKVQKEQEKMAEDLTQQESNLSKRESILERKEEEIRKNLQKLTDKRNLVDMKLKQLKEIETRTESLEEELHKRHQEHLLKVELHSKDYQNQVEHLETVRHDLQQKSADIDRRFQEVRALKKEVKLWQKEAEKDLNNKVEELLKEKSNVEVHKQNLKNLQYEVEKAGTKVIDHLVNLDQASKKLDKLREKLDTSQEKLQMIANHNAKQHKLLTERETNLGVKEQHFEALQKDWERRVKDLTNREASMNLKEQAPRSRVNDPNSECASKTKLLKESKQHCDAPLYKITEEKLEVSKNIQLPATPQKEEVDSSITQHKAKRGEASKAEEQAETLNLEMLQREFARILKERESLKVQQHELEETKNKVQDAKLTLAAQLRATKEMVVEASITAEKASREREALERERRLLGKAQKEIEAALSAREAKLSLDEKNLEKDRQFLEDEKERAMGIIYKAGQMQQLMGTSGIDGVATKHLKKTAPVSGNVVPGRADNHSCTDHDRHDSSRSALTHPNPRFDMDMINLWRENECAKIEREEKMIMDEISRLHCQHQGDIKQSGLRELSNDLEVTSFPSSKGVGGNSYHLFQRDLAPSLEALELPRQGSCEVHAHDIYRPVLDEPSDGFFSGNETAFSRGGGKQHLEEMERMHGNHDIYYQDVIPSQNRLENVMQSLVSARQASRSRLHRTKSLLQSLPLTSGGLVVTEVQQVLCALTERLDLMEQMEDELADELREVYRAAFPDSEGIIVDKVELLCKMEEQQTLRAEWEEDMQCQLEKISILQANSQASSCFSTPIKRTVFDRIVSPPSTNQSM
ncbi:hypothetical protein GOP47_0014386, partial [Adiantum capillus-veneris]